MAETLMMDIRQTLSWVWLHSDLRDRVSTRYGPHAEE